MSISVGPRILAGIVTCTLGVLSVALPATLNPAHAAEAPVKTPIESGAITLFSVGASANPDSSEALLDVAVGNEPVDLATHFIAIADEAAFDDADPSLGLKRAHVIGPDAQDNEAKISLGWDASGITKSPLNYDTAHIRLSYTGPDNGSIYVYTMTDNQPSPVLESGALMLTPGSQDDDLRRHNDALAITAPWVQTPTWAFTEPGIYNVTASLILHSPKSVYSQRVEKNIIIAVGEEARDAAARGATVDPTYSPRHDAPTPPESPIPDDEDADDEDTDEDAPGGANDAASPNAPTPPAPAPKANDTAPADPGTDDAKKPAPSVESPIRSACVKNKPAGGHQKDPVTKRDMLYRQHVDAAHISWDEGEQKLRIDVVDGPETNVVPADSVAIRVGPDADDFGREVSRLKVPEGGALSFLGEAGDIVWNAPSQYYKNHAPVWAGYGAGAMPTQIDPDSLALEFVGAQGPDGGEVSVWRSGSGAVDLDFTTRTNITTDNRRYIVPGGHGHINWSFSKPGRYWLTFQASATNKQTHTRIVSDTYKILWLVGEDADVQLPACTTAGAQIVTPAEAQSSTGGPDQIAPRPGDEAGSEAEIPGLVDGKRPYVCAAPGHYDLSIGHNDEGALETYLRDDSSTPSVNRPSYSVVIPVPDSSKMEIDPKGRLKGLGALTSEKQELWTLPQDPSNHLVQLGFNTQRADYSKFNSDGITMYGEAFDGPGTMVYWDYDPAYGATAHMTLRPGKGLTAGLGDANNQSQKITFDAPIHRHYAVTFNKAGFYNVQHVFKAMSPDGAKSYRDFELYYAVGDDAITRACGADAMTNAPKDPGPAPQPGPSTPGATEPAPPKGPMKPLKKFTTCDLVGTLPNGATMTLGNKHADIFNLSSDADGALSLALKEDKTAVGTVHAPEEVLLTVGQFTRQSIPDQVRTAIPGLPDAAYVLDKRGEKQDSELFPGWDTEGIRAGGYHSATFDVSFTGPEGGQIFGFDVDSTTGAFTSVLTGGGFEFDPAGSTITQPFPAHRHINWAFTKAGRYILTVTGRAASEDGAKSASTEPHTYTIDVGDKEHCTDPKTPAPQAPPASPQAPPTADGSSNPAGSSNPVGQATGSRGINAARAVKEQCIATTITREATAEEAKNLSSRVSSGAQANTAVATLHFSVGPNASGNATSGHFDMGPAIENGTVVAKVKDDRSQPASWVDPGSLTFALSDAAKLAAPAAVSFVAPEGSDIWMVPATQIEGVPWLGLNSQREEIVNGTSGGVVFTLTDVQGPGKVAVFNAGALGAGVGTHVFDGPGSSYTLPTNTHAHQNWLFTQPGDYRLTISMQVTPVSGELKGSVSSAVPGAGTLVPTGEKGPNGLPMVKEVVGRTPSGQPCELSAANLARTGSDASSVALASAVMTLAGAAALAWSRRNRRIKPAGVR